jgi:hypothetical protein
MPAKKKSLTFSVPVERGLQRFRELIVYISRKSEHDPHYGATKLNKILYYSDFRAYERFGVPLTGVSYFRLPKGPAPKILLVVRGELEKEGAVRVEHHILGGGYEQHRVIALRSAVMEHFTADEVAIVDEVIEELWSQTATEVSDASHDIRWKTLIHKSDMPYEFAFLSDEPPTEDDIATFDKLNKEYRWE